MLRHAISAVLALCLVAWQAGAETRATQEARERVAPMFEAMAIPDLLDIMREEGILYAAELEEEMFPGRGRERWREMVARIYRPERLEEIMLDELAARMAPEDIAPVSDFFGAPLGQRIVDLEITARRAMLQPSIEEASREVLSEMRSAGDPRLDLLEGFVETNDLVEMNIAGALNANYAFYVGMNAAAGFETVLSEEEMLRDVWAQEPEIRVESDSWVHSYVALAYQPLSDEEIVAYTDFSRSEPGRHLNANLFASFDVLFRTVSRELGMAAAQFMAGEDL